MSKYNSFLVLFLMSIVILSSCNNEIDSDIQDESDLIPNQYFADDFIPDFLKTNDYVSISRKGSIQWSSTESILIVPKKIINENHKMRTFDSYYIKLNYFNNTLNKDNCPSVEIYRLDIHGTIDKKFLDGSKTHRSNIEDLYEGGFGEGYCANYYVIREMVSDSIIYVNRSSDDNIKNAIINLFSNISPQEHFQSFSLLANCSQMDSIASDIMFNRNGISSDSRYILPYSEPIKYGR